MNLQESHELTGKVLKERPELASSLFVDATYGKSPIVAYGDSKFITVFGRPTPNQSKELIWQAN